MLQQLNFYLRHSLNDLRVNGQRTFFALLCIAAGVAAIVSLQTVSLMIGDTLTTNLQESNRSDIQVSLGVANGFTMPGSPEFEDAVDAGILEELPINGPFGAEGAVSYRVGLGGLEQIQAWLDERFPGQVEMTYPYQIADFSSIFLGGIGTSLTNVETGATASQATPVVIDPNIYPFYDQIVSVDGVPLAELIQSPTDIVIDKKVADALGVQVGDTIRVNGVNQDFTLRGIVPTDAEVADLNTGLFAALFGFYYLPYEAIQYFDGLTPHTDKFYLKVNDPAQVRDINAALLQTYPYFDTTTVDELRVNNQELSDRINQLVTVMGLVSLLLGSIGIINTMQVIVRRRTVEVAVLKTIGLEAGQVTILFLVEAFIMGVVGSLLGILLGWVTTFLIKGVAEGIVGQTLPFRIALAPAVNGLIVGTLVTTIFGFLPTLAAGQVRPGVVLRPNDNIVPRAGCLRTLLALVVIVAALSVVAYTIIGNFPVALGATIGAFLVAGFLIFLLSMLIWLIGRFFPSFGIVDLKIALRQMLAGRGRAATTLLALVVGVFSLSLITLMAESLNQTLASALGSEGGGNVIIAVSSRNSIPAIEQALNSIEGVSSHQVNLGYFGDVVSIERADGTILDREALKRYIEERSTLKQTIETFGGDASEIDVGEEQLHGLSTMTARPVNLPSPNSITQGRDFTEADAGQPVIIYSQYSWTVDAGIQVGDKVTYQFEGSAEPITFEVVGIAPMPTVGGPTSGMGTFIPLDSLPQTVQPQTIQVLVDAASESIPEVRQAVSGIPGTFVLETAVFVKLITSLLGTFTAFPTMVAILGLIVGGVVIANSVALTTMERRREIAVMKSVGLQRERVLGMLLLENGILGLIGGLIGVGLGLLILVALLSLSGGGLVIPYGTALLLMLLCIAVALIAAATTAWGASGEKPLNVLRYE
jgi:putative ABC transport system permease protein